MAFSFNYLYEKFVKVNCNLKDCFNSPQKWKEFIKSVDEFQITADGFITEMEFQYSFKELKNLINSMNYPIQSSDANLIRNLIIKTHIAIRKLLMSNQNGISKDKIQNNNLLDLSFPSLYISHPSANNSSFSTLFQKSPINIRKKTTNQLLNSKLETVTDEYL
jgi:hypothetical protein